MRVKILLAAAAATACASSLVHGGGWTPTVLAISDAQSFTSINSVWGNRQGGFVVDFARRPLLWLGSPGSVSQAVFAPNHNDARIVALTENSAVGDSYDPTLDREFVVIWNADGTAIQHIILPPSGFTDTNARNAAGNQQVGYVSNRDTGQNVPALWNGTTESFVNLLPSGFESGDARATDGVQQVGDVSPPGDEPRRAALWSGSAASFVNLHPGPPWAASRARGVDGGIQVGTVSQEDAGFAAAWTGTAGSMVLLHPSNIPNVVGSTANDIHSGIIVGDLRVDLGGVVESRAALWNGLSPASYFDLHATLGPGYRSSNANAVWVGNDGVIRVVGGAFVEGTLVEQEILWTFDPCGFPLVVPATPASLAGDLDANFVTDTCEPPAPAQDCNNNGLRDSIETLVFTNETFENVPGAWSINGDAILDGRTVVLTRDFGSGGSVVRAPLTSGPTQRLRAAFDFRLDLHSLVPADGISFTLYPDSLLGTDAVFGEDGINLPGVVAVKFNTFENVAGEGSNSMYIRYGGTDIAANTNLPVLLTDTNWHRAFIDLTPDGRITVALGTITGQTHVVFDNVQLPNYQPQRYNIGIGGRTGGFFSRQTIANIRLGVNGPNDLNADGIPDSCACPCPSDYDNSGSPIPDIDDLVAFFNDFAEGDGTTADGDPSADVDCTGEGSIPDIDDILRFFEAFGGDCP